MRWILVLIMGLMAASAAHAGQPIDGAIGLQAGVTEIKHRVADFHSLLVVIITVITIFVLALLLYVIFRFNSKAHPVPKKFSHNTTVEVVWTVGPVLILLLISFFSLSLLFFQETFPDVPEEEIVNVKTQGNQWNWTYFYQDVVDEDGYPLEFTSNPLHRGLSSDPDTGLRNLSVDYPMVVPVDTVIRVYIAASDVIHSWTVPAFGVKTDAVPGRLNELWFKAEKTGTFYGQCSELCGKDHAYMPIEVRVVTAEQYAQWVAQAQEDLDAANALVAQFSNKNATQLALAQ